MDSTPQPSPAPSSFHPSQFPLLQVCDQAIEHSKIYTTFPIPPLSLTTKRTTKLTNTTLWNTKRGTEGGLGNVSDGKEGYSILYSAMKDDDDEVMPISTTFAFPNPPFLQLPVPY